MRILRVYNKQYKETDHKHAINVCRVSLSILIDQVIILFSYKMTILRGLSLGQKGGRSLSIIFVMTEILIAAADITSLLVVALPHLKAGQSGFKQRDVSKTG
ncbi:hypothetical protein BCV71DRAFT_237635 [Rhizopus microsporus]|uniref:Uncharacterized protein n=1 Tax=Rhizopus microsporus TaxID=58291 RepID=A0A1X0RTI0_RHIZD|nr:hypothetical protein BCV71DRAFT_237635 [Rhizopus microsporus]